jgi:hypothetical protein
VLTGKVIGQCLPHTNNELLHFLKKVDREVPKGLAVHVITDNYGTRGHENVQAWLAKHPRFHFHFTPFELMAQPGGTVVQGAHPKSHTPGRVPLRPRPRGRHL